MRGRAIRRNATMSFSLVIVDDLDVGRPLGRRSHKVTHVPPLEVGEFEVATGGGV